MKIKNTILFWFLLPTILISVITVTLCYFHTCKIVKQNIFDHLEITAGDLQKDVHFLLEAKKGRTTDFSSDGFIRNCTEAIITKNDSLRYHSEHLYTHLTENKQPLDTDIIEIFIVDPGGKVISSTEINNIGKDISEEVYFSETVKSGSYVNDLHSLPGSGFNTFEVSKLLLSQDGKKNIGLIVNRYCSDALSRIASGGTKDTTRDEKKECGETGELYIVNNDRVMVTESRFVKDAVLKQVVDTDGVRHAFDTKTGTTSVYNGYRDIMVLGVSKYYEEMDWVIVAEKGVDEAFTPVVWLRNFTIVMGIFGILIIVVISNFISTGITSPIDKLIEGTKRISGGDLEKSISIHEMHGEMKELGEAMNTMMMSLSKSTRENKHLFLLVKKSRDEWRRTFDAIEDMIIIHDRNHKILMANRAFYEKFKLDKNELINRNCHDIFHGADSNRGSCLLERSINNANFESEIVNDPHTGGTFLVSAYPLKDENNGIYAYVHLAKDITLQKELQAEVIEKAGELEKVNKELEDFIYLTSHDLKEPLFVISAYISKLSNAYNGAYDEKGRKCIDRIKANIKIMDRRIHEIMEVLRAGNIEYNYQDSDSFVIVDDVTHALHERIAENDINISIEDNLPIIYCDVARIKDVFSNLITNAIKFMGKGRHTASRSSESPDSSLNPSVLCYSKEDKGSGVNTQLRNITIGCEEGESYHKFFVEDTGIGIQKNHQDQIFKIFKRLNDIDVEGTGVGLAIVKKIIERHKGTIWAESPVYDGKGSRFCFTIPVSKSR